MRFHRLGIAILFLPLIVNDCSAAKLHVIIAADTQDPKVGDASQGDASTVARMFADLPKQAYEVHRVPATSMSAKGLPEFIRQQTVAPDDAILFYYSGHGGYSRSAGHFLSLREGGEKLDRAVILEELRARRARLAVLITESCFNYVELPSEPKGSAEHRVFVPSVIPPLYRQLFFNVRGVVDLNACERGQKAMTFPDLSQGSLFTVSFSSQLQANKDRDDLDWAGFVAIVKEQTNSEFKFIYKRGVTAQDENGRFRQRSQDPAFVTPLQVTRVNADSRPSNQAIVFETTEFEIDADSGDTFQVRYRKQIHPQDGTVASRTLNRQYQGRATLVYATDGTAFWRWLSTVAPANPPPRKPLGVNVRNCRSRGVHVSSVTPGSPATYCVDLDTGDQIRLEVGDHIEAVNQQPTNDYREVLEAVRAATDRIDLQVRDRRTNQLRRLVTSLRGDPQRLLRPNLDKPLPHSTPPPANNPGRFGVSVHTCREGVHIDRVLPNSPATRCRTTRGQRISIEPGDHLVSMNGVPLRAVEDFARVLADSPRLSTIHVKDKNSGWVLRLSIQLN